MSFKSKFFVIILSVLLIFQCIVPSYASSSPHEEIYTKIIYVKDDEGNKIPIIIESEEDDLNLDLENKINTRSWTPEAEVGAKKYRTYKVSNSVLGITGLVEGMTSLQIKRVKRKIAYSIGSAIIKDGIVSTLGAAASYALVFAAIGGTVNELLGNNGFKLDVVYEYQSTYINEGGIYFYEWDIISLSPGVY